MDSQRWLFQIEDGTPLSFAIHESVPQHDQLREVIDTYKGCITEDVASADFVILVSNLPGIEQLLHVLHGEGKLVIQDWWIWNSAHAGRLLPWYHYEMVESKNMHRMEDSARDLHELVACSARYWPLLKDEELYRFMARRCPHLSIEELRNLHISNQASFNASAAYARLRLDEGLAPGCSLTIRPKMSFGSPNKTKDTPPSVVPRPPIIPPALVQPPRLSPVDIVMRTPTSLASGAPTNEAEGRIRRSEAPEPGPNLDEIPSEDDIRQAVVPLLPTSNPLATTIPPNLDRHEEVNPPTNSKNQQVHVRSPSGKFTKPPKLARSAIAPTPIRRNRLPRAQRELADLARTQFEDERSGQLTKFRHRRLSLPPPRSPSSSIEPVYRVPRNWATPEDLEALAVWNVEYPKGEQSLKGYYQKFEVQHKGKGTSRSAQAWISVVKRHEKIIQRRIEELVNERKLAGLLSADAEVPSLRTIHPPAGSSDSKDSNVGDSE